MEPGGVLSEWPLQRQAHLQRKVQALTEKTVRDFRLAGDAAYNNYTFDKALTAYQRAHQFISKDTHPRLWASVTIEIGLSHRALGIRTKGTEVAYHLNKAHSAFQQALEVYTRADLPQVWATIQNNLGRTLAELGKRLQDAELLNDAKGAIQGAYTFYMDSGYTHYAEYFESKLSEINQLIEELK